jgi:hypothetical protein
VNASGKLTWHWIWRRRDLTVYEKAVLTAIRCEQFRDNPVVLSHERIAALASVSRSTVMRCEESLQRAGMLQVKIFPGRRRAKAYRAIQVQQELFVAGDRPRAAMGKAGGGIGAVDKTVEKLCGADLDVSRGHGPPGLMSLGDAHRSGSSSGTANSKPRAENRAELDQRRKIEAKLRRLAREDDVRRELMVGSGPEISR